MTTYVEIGIGDETTYSLSDSTRLVLIRYFIEIVTRITRVGHGQVSKCGCVMQASEVQ